MMISGAREGLNESEPANQSSKKEADSHHGMGPELGESRPRSRYLEDGGLRLIE